METMSVELNLEVPAIRQYWRRYFKSYLEQQRMGAMRQMLDGRIRANLAAQETRLPERSALKFAMEQFRAAGFSVEYLYRESTRIYTSMFLINGMRCVVYEAYRCGRVWARNRARANFNVARARLAENDLAVFVIRVRKFPDRIFTRTAEELYTELFGDNPQRTSASFTVAVERPRRHPIPHRKRNFWAYEGNRGFKKLKRLIDQLTARAK